MALTIGPIQILLASIVLPIGVFILGFYIGRKYGYSKGMKDAQKHNNAS